ncbi:MAG: T9SS type A sorting domain-containing protein, partial [Hymenobacter sp.]
YLLEVPAPSSGGTYSTNIYTVDLSNGQATGRNLFGQVPFYISNIATFIEAPLTWNGSVNASWNNPANWTPNRVPTATDDVFIPGPSATILFQPTVATANEASFSVTLGSGAVLNTQDGSQLSVYGNFANNEGTVTGSGTGTIAFVGVGQQEISGANQTNFRNLTINNNGGVITSGAVSVERALTVTSNLTIGTNQVFTLLSNPTTGVAYVVNNGGVVNGTATVRRYIDTSINPGFGYRHYSAPVINTTVGDLATSTFTPVFNAAYNTSTAPRTTVPYPTVYGYNQTQYENSPAITDTPEFDKGYYSPASGSVAWVPGTGYTVNLNGSELVDFTGTLATGNFSTTPQGRSSKAKAGWQLLGNPYPSSLDWNQVAASGLSGIENAVYVFKSTSQYSGSYASYVNGQGTNGGTNVIPVAQGFFVRTSAGATGSINFTNAQRITTDATAPFQRTAADTRPQLLLELSNGTTASQTDVYFESGATPAFDKAYDATALPFINGLVLATQAGTETLAINGQPALTGAVTVPLQVAVATAGTYTLRAATLANLPAGYHAYLRDAVLNTYTDLATTPSVALSLTTTPATGRYAVLFTSASPLATAPAALAALANVYPSPAHGTATLLLPQALRGTSSSTVQLLNSLGQVVLTRTLAAGGPDSIELPLAGLSAGIYVVRATTAAGLVAKRLVIQ